MDRKVVLVTGGNSGIGRGIALRYAREGFAVAIAARDPEKGARTKAEIEALGVPCLFVKADLAAEADAAQVIAAVKERFGRLDVLVNNAASAPAAQGSKAAMIRERAGTSCAAPIWMRRTSRPPTRCRCSPHRKARSSTSPLPRARRQLGALLRRQGGSGRPHADAGGGRRAAWRALQRRQPGWIATDPEMAKALAGGDGTWDLPPACSTAWVRPTRSRRRCSSWPRRRRRFVTGQTPDRRRRLRRDRLSLPAVA